MRTSIDERKLAAALSRVGIVITYASGEVPEVGDLIEFGSQKTRLLVTRVRDMRIMVGEISYDPSLAVLVARHGEPVNR